jgi:hypothetical protein
MASIASLALIAASALAPGEAPAPPPGAPIVVEGARPGKHPVRDFVKALTGVPSYGQIVRFHSPVCPVAMGLAEVQNARIAERMRRVAAAARAPLAPERCTPNAFVIVAPDKQAAIIELNRRFPAYFSGMSERQVRALADSAGPATAWQVTSLLSADGQQLQKAVGADYSIVRSVNTPSRIKAASMPTVVASVVVIDVRAAAGLTLTQLADYAAMRTLADVDPGRAKVGVPTILDILAQPDDRPLPVTLTDWDLGFLKALYATDNAYLAGHQRGDMEAVLKKEVQRSGGDPRR